MEPGPRQLTFAKLGGFCGLALCACLLALGAELPSAAQATDFDIVEIVVSGDNDAKVNAAECDADQALTLRWSVTGTPTADQTVRIFTDTASSCASTTPLASLYSATAAQGPLTLEVLAQSQLHGGPCEATEDHERYICLELSGGGLSKAQTTALAIVFDLQAPADPVVSAVGGDANVKLSWAFESGTPDDLAGFRVASRPESSTAEITQSATLEASTRSFQVTGLNNDQAYELWVETMDDFGNWSEGSLSVSATPKSSEDFWEHYRSSGGSQGGCSQPGGGSALALIFSVLCLVAGRPRRRSLGVLLAALCFFPAASFAEEASAGLAEGSSKMAAVETSPEGTQLPHASTLRPAHKESRHWIFEAELGPYLPEIDAGLGSGTPYKDIFGTHRAMLGRFRIDRALYQGVGQLDLGIGAGFGQSVGKGVFADGTRSPDTTVFNWVPFELGLAYRFDYTALHWNVPLVPYFRAGLISDLWWILDGNGKVATDGGGRRAQGFRWGYEYGAGLELHLDVLDPRLAKDFQRSSGVDNSYLFVMVRRMEIDGFGSTGFRLSDTSWSIGVSLEF